MKYPIVMPLVLSAFVAGASALAQEWSTPEALRAFGKPGDSVKGGAPAITDPENLAPLKITIDNTGNKKNTPIDKSRACTGDITTDCTSYRVISPWTGSGYSAPDAEASGRREQKILVIP